jgi:hypothetical protein
VLAESVPDGNVIASEAGPASEMFALGTTIE